MKQLIGALLSGQGGGVSVNRPLNPGLWLVFPGNGAPLEAHLTFAVHDWPADELNPQRLLNSLVPLLEGGRVRVGLRSEPLPENGLDGWVEARSSGGPAHTELARRCKERLQSGALALRQRSCFLWVSRPLSARAAPAAADEARAWAARVNGLLLGMYGTARLTDLSQFAQADVSQAYEVEKLPKEVLAELDCYLDPDAEFIPRMAMALEGAEPKVRGSYWAWVVFTPFTTAQREGLRRRTARRARWPWASEEERATHETVAAAVELPGLGLLDIEIRVDETPSVADDANLLRESLLLSGYTASEPLQGRGCHVLTMSRLVAGPSVMSHMPYAEGCAGGPVCKGGALLHAADQTLAAFSPFACADASNNHVFVAGNEGAARQAFLNELVLAHASQGQRAWVIQAEDGGIADLAAAFGARRIPVDPFSVTGLNPMQFVTSDEQLEDVLPLVVEWLLLYAGDGWVSRADPQLRAWLERALATAWRVTRTLSLPSVCALLARHAPAQFQDFARQLESQEKRLDMQWFSGAAKHVLPDHPVVVWDVRAWRGTPLEALVVQTLVLMLHLRWSDYAGCRQKLVVLDSAHRLEPDGSPGLMEAILRRARKVGAGFVLAADGTSAEGLGDKRSFASIALFHSSSQVLLPMSPDSMARFLAELPADETRRRAIEHMCLSEGGLTTVAIRSGSWWVGRTIPVAEAGAG